MGRPEEKNVKLFHLGDILSITDGNLVSPRRMDGVYDILGYMTGAQLFTHQLPHAAETCAPALLAQHPQLASVVFDESLKGEAEVDQWLAGQVATHGEMLGVEPLASGDYVSIDPVIEAETIFGKRERPSGGHLSHVPARRI